MEGRFRRGRRALVVSAIVYVAVLAWSFAVLPARVPSHFDGYGRVDGWSSKTSLMIMWCLLGVVVLVGMPALARIATAGEGTLVNMPAHYKDHWFHPSRIEEFRTRFADDLEWFTGVTALMLATAMGASTWVGRSGADSLPPWCFPLLIGAYLVVTVVWTVRLMRAYRPPEG